MWTIDGFSVPKDIYAFAPAFDSCSAVDVVQQNIRRVIQLNIPPESCIRIIWDLMILKLHPLCLTIAVYNEQQLDM